MGPRKNKKYCSFIATTFVTKATLSKVNKSLLPTAKGNLSHNKVKIAISNSKSVLSGKCFESKNFPYLRKKHTVIMLQCICLRKNVHCTLTFAHSIFFRSEASKAFFRQHSRFVLRFIVGKPTYTDLQ